ncbi:MAG TPA: hypothetical protein VGM51_00145 [Armatimonadota bacterium]|jgi:hypothetical protein
MKMRWAAALLLLTGLCVNRAWADGFGFTVANATVTNVKGSGNTNVNVAEVGDTFTVTGAAFTSYRSSGAAPAINDNDLNKYTADLTGTATQVTGNQVRYEGTFTLKYTGSVSLTIVTGELDVRAVYGPDGSAVLTGFLLADAKLPLPAPWNNTDFSLYNPGRFYGVYKPAPGDYTHGSLACNLNAGNIGFATSISDTTVQNQKAPGNTDTAHAEVGDTFSLLAPLASYYTIGGPPLNNNDLSSYTLGFNATVTNVTGTLVTYVGTFTLTYTAPDFPSGLVIETGSLSLLASYNEPFTGAAKLTAQLIATNGNATTQTPWDNTDYAIFNPGVFTGTYKPTVLGSATGIVSGSLQGGVLGFSASIADGTIINSKAPGNLDVNKAEVGDPFHASGPLAAYLAVGAPPLLDRDLSKYTVVLDGTATAVIGTTVMYDGVFRITYSGGITANVESGTFNIVAVYDAAANAQLSGVLNAKAGAESSVPPFNTTDYAAFNPGKFTGKYTRVQVGFGTLHGGLIGGTLTVPIQSRLLGTAIEGSATAATQTDDARRAIVASGSTLFVLDPATGNDAPGWEGGKTLSGKVPGRSAVLKDALYVGTDTGTVYAFDLKTGALINSVQLDPNAHIYSGMAVVDKTLTGEPTDTIVVPVFRSDLNQTLLYKIPTTLTAPLTVKLSDGAISTSAASVPMNGLIFVGSNDGLFTVRYSDLSIQSTVATPTTTSPLTVGDAVYVGTGTGTTLLKLNVATGVSDGHPFELSSPLTLSAFYEKRSNLIQAGTSDGRISSFDNAGSFMGYTLPGLFNPDNTGGSQSMPVSSNNVLYRATENKEILSCKPLNGDDQQMIAVMSPVRGPMSATGQTPGADYLIATSPDGTVHLIGVR